VAALTGAGKLGWRQLWALILLRKMERPQASAQPLARRDKVQWVPIAIWRQEYTRLTTTPSRIPFETVLRRLVARGEVEVRGDAVRPVLVFVQESDTVSKARRL
jgi:hypothetical protein